MRQYPIWNIVQACIYKQSKNWGAQKNCAVEVRVGTGSGNSNTLVEHETTHRTHSDGTKEFRFFVDGVMLKRAIQRFDNKGKPHPLEFVSPSYELSFDAFGNVKPPIKTVSIRLSSDKKLA